MNKKSNFDKEFTSRRIKKKTAKLATMAVQIQCVNILNIVNYEN